MGGAFTIRDTLRLELLAAARAAYLLRRSGASTEEMLEYPQRKFSWMEDYDLSAEKHEGTIIKSFQGFAEDIWQRVLKRALPEGSPTDDEEFERFYDRVRTAIRRTSHIRDHGPAVEHSNKLIRDFHGRRLSLSESLEVAAQGRPAPPPPPFVRCTGPEPSGEGGVWSHVEQEYARRNGLHRFFVTARTASRVDGRRRTAEGRRFERKHQRDGTDSPQYVSVGRWRKGEADRRDRSDLSVRVPWLIADLDPPYGEGRRWCARQGRMLVHMLADMGVDPSTVVVAYSGNCSLHIRIPDGALGCPIYQDAEAAASSIERLFDRLCGDRETLQEAIDGNLFRPEHLIRVIGSVHPKTGRRVVGTDGETFLEHPPEFLFHHAERDFQYSRPRRYPVPRRAGYCAELSQLLTPNPKPLSRARRAGANEPDVRQRLSPYGHGTTDGVDRRLVLDRVSDGVTEGEDWGSDIDARYVGRNWAALFVSHEQLRKRGSADRAWRAVRDWNGRNQPPLQEAELKTVFRKAWKFRRERTS